MATPKELYIKFKLKVNKNATSSNRAVDEFLFVTLFNECKNRWAEKSLKDKDSILIDSLWGIVKGESLTQKVDFEDSSVFDLSKDFYELIRVEGICKKKDECKKRIFFREVKNQDKNILLSNSLLEPNFDFEWSFCSLGENKIHAYKKGFDILELKVDYYKVIPDLDIAGYKKPNGQPSTDVSVDLGDQYLDQIINLCAEEYERNIGNAEGLSIAKDRTINQE